MVQRSVSIDYLKFLLALGVVLGHSILIRMKLEEWSFLVGMGLLRSLVPTFAVLSGYCFHVTCSHGKAVRWLLWLIVAYLFWTLFYIPIWFEADTSLVDVLRVVFFGTMHLWYIAGLILAGGLIVGFVRLGQRTNSGLWPMLMAALGFASVGWALSFWIFFQELDLPVELSRNGMVVIFPYAAIGYALAAWVAKNGRDALPRLGIIWLAVALLFGAKLVEAMFDLRTYGLGFRSLPELPLLALPAPVFLFLGFLRMNLPEPPMNLSSWSASVYFLHIFAMIAARHFFGISSLPAFFLVGVLVPIALQMIWDRARPILVRFWRGRRTAPESMSESILHEGPA